MFGFQGGERVDVVARKKGRMAAAQRRWGFLTHFDLLSIRNESQLRTMVGIRLGIPLEQAKRDVGAWMRGKQF